MRWSVVAGAGLLALAAGSALAWTTIRQDREFQRLIVVGDEALRAGQTSIAIEAFSGAAALETDSMLAYLKRGDTYRRRGDFAAAMRDLEQAAALEPTAPRPIELLGDVNLAMGRFSAAVEQYRRFAVLDDRSARVLYKRALAHYRLAAYGDALEAIEQSLDIDPKLVEAHALRGLCLAAQGREQDAIRALRQALDINPAFAYAHDELAVMFAGRGRTRDELEALEAVAALDAQRVEPTLHVAAAYARAGRIDAAMLTLARAAERFPENPGVYEARGRIALEAYERTGDPDMRAAARIALERAIANDGATSATLALYGRALLRSGDLARAEGVLSQATTRLPVDPAAYRDLAEAASRLGHAEVAGDASLRYRLLTR
jgi:tetratricopeptide (TPR) repeat protein